jgi:hypothetical protein
MDEKRFTIIDTRYGSPWMGVANVTAGNAHVQNAIPLAGSKGREELAVGESTPIRWGVGGPDKAGKKPVPFKLMRVS